MSRRFKFNHNQLTLPFGEGNSSALSYEAKEKAFWLLVSICLFSLALYIYGINTTAHNIAVREHLEREVVELNTKLSSLEFAYIEASNGITLETASQYGFREVKKPLYVSRDAYTGSLTFNTED